MATAETAEAETPARPSKRPLILGLGLALILGGGAFYALYSGTIPTGGQRGPTGAGSPVLDVAFVPIEPLMVTLGPGSPSRHLRFEAQLEVTPAHRNEVAGLMPRVLDVLNSYLRAVDAAELEDPRTLIMLRAQMLRRVQLVTGQDRVRDLLITQFVLN